MLARIGPTCPDMHLPWRRVSGLHSRGGVPPGSPYFTTGTMTWLGRRLSMWTVFVATNASLNCG